MSEPTPEKLRELAEWFDDPSNPAVVVENVSERLTAGYMLRQVAHELERARGEEGDGGE